MSKKEENKEIIVKKDDEDDMFDDYIKMDEFHDQCDKMLDVINKRITFDTPFTKRSRSIDMVKSENGNGVKITLIEETEFDYWDMKEEDLERRKNACSCEWDGDCYDDDKDMLVYANDPAEMYPQGKYVTQEVAHQWDKEREKIKKDREKNKSK